MTQSCIITILVMTSESMYSTRHQVTTVMSEEPVKLLTNKTISKSIETSTSEISTSIQTYTSTTTTLLQTTSSMGTSQIQPTTLIYIASIQTTTPNVTIPTKSTTSINTTERTGKNSN